MGNQRFRSQVDVRLVPQWAMRHPPGHATRRRQTVPDFIRGGFRAKNLALELWVSRPLSKHEQKRNTERKNTGVDKRNCEDMQFFLSETRKDILPSTCHLVSTFFNPSYWTTQSRGCAPPPSAHYRGAYTPHQTEPAATHQPRNQQRN